MSSQSDRFFNATKETVAELHRYARWRQTTAQEALREVTRRLDENGSLDQLRKAFGGEIPPDAVGDVDRLGSMAAKAITRAEKIAGDAFVEMIDMADHFWWAEVSSGDDLHIGSLSTDTLLEFAGEADAISAVRQAAREVLDDWRIEGRRSFGEEGEEGVLLGQKSAQRFLASLADFEARLEAKCEGIEPRVPRLDAASQERFTAAFTRSRPDAVAHANTILQNAYSSLQKALTFAVRRTSKVDTDIQAGVHLGQVELPYGGYDDARVDALILLDWKRAYEAQVRQAEAAASPSDVILQAWQDYLLSPESQSARSMFGEVTDDTSRAAVIEKIRHVATGNEVLEVMGIGVATLPPQEQAGAGRGLELF